MSTQSSTSYVHLVVNEVFDLINSDSVFHYNTIDGMIYCSTSNFEAKNGRV